MSLLTKIKTIVPLEDVLEEKHEQAYARIDQSTNVQECWPKLVVRVNNTDQLKAVVKICLDERVPIVMRGSGSGKSGGAVPFPDSVVIDITKLNRILLIDQDNLLAEVEPGVILSDLQEAVAACGLYYPPDPASSALCTLGGNVAENAAGPSTLKYGSTRDYFLGGQAILGTGEVIDFGKRCPKGVAGYDLASLLCGSEGTLAIFTKLILRLLPQPKSMSSAIFFFADEHEALKAVNAILLQGHLPKTLEYVDEVCLRAWRTLEQIKEGERAKACLIIECDASFDGGAQLQLSAIASMLKDFGLTHHIVAATDEDRRLLWQNRSRLSDACSRYLGHKLSEDVAVPLGVIHRFGEQLKTLSPDPRVVVGAFGHAGDGNLHVQIMFDDQHLEPVAQKVRHQILMLVLSLNGTITAEHGIGLQKKAYLPLEQSSALIELQKRIKYACDPFYLLNPGKIFDQ